MITLILLGLIAAILIIAGIIIYFIIRHFVRKHINTDQGLTQPLFFCDNYMLYNEMRGTNYD